MSKYKIGDLFKVTNPHINKEEWEGIAMLASSSPYEVVAISIFDSNKNAILGLRYNMKSVVVESPYSITEEELREILDYHYEYELITEDMWIEFKRKQ